MASIVLQMFTIYWTCDTDSEGVEDEIERNFT